jgi:acyl carrier protein
MSIETTIRNAMAQVAELGDCELIEDINDDTILLECGLDSLGYAMLVAQLEEVLGFDPFTEQNILDYPSTFSEFVDIYQRFAEKL